MLKVFNPNTCYIFINLIQMDSNRDGPDEIYPIQYLPD